MQRLAATLPSRPAPAPLVDAEYIERHLLDLVPTDVIRERWDAAQAEVTQLEELDRDAPEPSRKLRRARYVVESLSAAMAFAAERDRLQAERPEGCWCLGLGGKQKRAVLTPADDVEFVFGVYCDCPEAEAARVRDDGVRHRRDAYARQLAVDAAFESAGIPEHFDGMTLETHPNHELAQRLQAWADTDRWLYLFGEYGVGKSGLAVALVRLFAEQGISTLFVTVPDLLERLRRTFGSDGQGNEAEIMDGLKRVDVLVLDDIGVEKPSDWVGETLFRLINSRHDNHKRTILTSNLDTAELARHIGKRPAWRIMELADVVKVEGPNLRVRRA